MSAGRRLPHPSRGTPDKWSYGLSTWIALRLLGVAYLVAFASLGVQVRGLIGERGILPATELLSMARTLAEPQGIGILHVLRLPTLAWLDASDPTLVMMCVVGAIGGALLAVGIAGGYMLPFLWLLYLSLSTVSGDFLSFQWDTLLLETGLLAIVIAPWTLVHRFPGSDPPPLARWLIWWLLFRLMFGAGLVKLASGDPLWRGLSALVVHYETQPLPTPVGWYAHQLPIGFQQASTAAVLAVELIVPWFIFGPRRLRHIACVLFLALQAGIALTGNYTFFNLLTAALSLTLIDDAAWPAWMWRPRQQARARGAGMDAQWAPHLLIAGVLTLVTAPLSVTTLVTQAGVTVPWASTMRPVRRALAPFRSINPYGLFAVMTVTRPEIVVEGSADGHTWKAYEFKYKPGDVERRPPWVAPHQPRLDWQMWFAALDGFDESPWFKRFCDRLLEGSAPVTDLLASNPFPEEPPKFVRATLFRYRFSSRDARDRDGAWWTREELGPYSQVLPAAPPTAGSPASVNARRPKVR